MIPYYLSQSGNLRVKLMKFISEITRVCCRVIPLFPWRKQIRETNTPVPTELPPRSNIFKTSFPHLISRYLFPRKSTGFERGKFHRLSIRALSIIRIEQGSLKAELRAIEI